MNRRHWLAAVPTGLASTAAIRGAERLFQPCINEVTTLEAPFEDECAAYRAAGFRNVELWLPKLFKLGLSPAAIGTALNNHELTAVSACAWSAPLASAQGELEPRLPELECFLEAAQALSVPRFIVFNGFSGEVKQDDYKQAAERMARIADLAAGYHVRIALEFIAGARFLGSFATALSVVRQAARPNLGVLLDTFHFYAGISKVEDLALARPGEIEHVHFHDAPASIPRERLTDRDRLPHGEGGFPLRAIAGALSRAGYRGNLSVELFGAAFQVGDPVAVAKRCAEAVARFC
jgi:sugar phosphate isomerase/epimerase